MEGSLVPKTRAREVTMKGETEKCPSRGRETGSKREREERVGRRKEEGTKMFGLCIKEPLGLSSTSFSCLFFCARELNLGLSFARKAVHHKAKVPGLLPGHLLPSKYF